MSEDLMSYQQAIDSNKKSDRFYSEKFKILLKRVFKKGLVTNLVGFLIGRCVIFGGITPFGVAFYAALSRSSINMFALFLSINIGILTTGLGIFQLKYILSTTLISIINILKPSQKNTNIDVRVFLSVFIIGNVLIFYKGFLLYDFILNIFEACIVLIFTLLFTNGIKYFKETEGKKVLTNEQLISITIMGIIAITGISNFQLFNVSIRNVLIILLIIIFSLNNGASVGATIGILSGLIISMSGTSSPVIIGVYGFCGLLSGVLKELGKLGVVVGFLLANSIITMYINGSTEVIINIIDIIFAGVIITLIPRSQIKKISEYFINPSFFSFAKRNKTERLKNITSQRLRSFSDSFYELANTFNDICDKNVNINKDDVSTLFEEVAEKVCRNCRNNTNCWTNKFYDTYQVMMGLLEKMEQKGHITQYDVPNYFEKKCLKLDEFVNATNYMFDLYNSNVMWQNKIIENRNIISQQIKSVSKVIHDLAREIDSEILFETSIERKIQIELIKHNVEVDEVMVNKNKNGKYEVTIAHEPCQKARKCSGNIVPIVSEIIGRRMVKSDVSCNYNKDICLIKLSERKNYRVLTGVASTSKDKHKISGDSYKMIELDEGKFIIALSDGMGSGKSASIESNTVLNLLEKFFKSGINKNLSIKLINSVLILKSTKESFTTVDLSIIDLFSAKVEFIKNGAAATFIKRQNMVEVVNSTSLPVGILNNVEMETSKKTLEDEDIIIMVSDGVLDSNKNIIEKEKWILKQLVNLETKNPKLIADYLLSKAKDNYKDQEADDMTVLVARISEKIC